MRRILLLFALILPTYSLISYENPHDRIPWYLKPLNEITNELKSSGFVKESRYFKGQPIPDEVWKRQPAPDKIQAGEFELINCSKAPAGQHETWIAINPKNPLNIIATSNDSRYISPPPLGYRMVAFYTLDGGKTWAESRTQLNQDLYISLPQNASQMTIFDPGITFDTKGNAYYCYGFTQTVEDGKNDNGVFVCRSTDGGKSWEEPIPVVLQIGGGIIPFHDRYMITSDINDNSPYKDNLYVTWKRFYVNPACLYSVSDDGGESWTQPRVLPGSEKNRTQSATPAIGPDGEFYVVWEDPDDTKWTTDAAFQKSTNAGQTWLSTSKVDQKLTTIGEDNKGRTVLTDKQKIRVGSDPVIAVDRSNGPRRGWIYIVQPGAVDGVLGLYMARSTDKGETWTSKIRVDNNNLNNDVFFPSVVVDSKTGHLAVFYYSSQNDPNNKGVDGYIAYSTDGNSFQNIRLTPQTWFIDRLSKVSQQDQEGINLYWGDYTSIASNDGKFFPLFWMPQPLGGDFNDLELFTAELMPIPKSIENLNAVSDWEKPTEIQLSWNDPSESLLGTPLGDFKIVILRNGTKVAEINKGVQTYTDKELTSGSQYSYELYVKDETGESKKVGVQIYSGGSAKALAPTNVKVKPAESGVLVEWINPAEHIDGSPATDLSHIIILVNNEEKLSVKEGITAGELKSAIVTLPTEMFYKIRLIAATTRGELITLSDTTNEFLAYSGAPKTDFADNFDDSQKLIPSYNSGTWGVTTIASKSAPNSITDTPEGNYKGGDNYVIFAPFIVSNGKTTLSFDHIAMIDETGSDSGILSISDDFGSTWKDLRSVNRTISSGFGKDVASSEWAYLGTDLSSYIGDTIFARIMLSANLFKHDDGWYIDNLELGDKQVSVENEFNFSALSVELVPNPVSQNSKLIFSAPISGEYEGIIYDILGNKQLVLMKTEFAAGEHQVSFDSSMLPAGVYYLIIRSGKMAGNIPLIIE